jgi:ATP-dependent Zn protease
MMNRARRTVARRTMQCMRKTAWHEAGHAVVAVELKHPFKKVDIIEDELCSGRLHWAKKSPEGYISEPHIINWIEHRIVVRFAGGAAQRRYAPHSNWAWGMGHRGNEPAPGSDLYHIDEWLRCLKREGDDAYRAQLEARAKALVKKLWPDIQRVAKALLKKKVLTQSQVRRLMNRARR